jgi:hypothetical protein
MKILSGGFSGNIGKEDISKPVVGNGSLHDITGNGDKSSNLCHIYKSNCQENSVVPTATFMNSLLIITVQSIATQALDQSS